jgi:exopolyphosphatase/guanosine-5'-triphosphate,3'-diphosphate pyrophosphatase
MTVHALETWRTGVDDMALSRPRMGVIDLGSNSIRLVVFEGAPRAPIPVFNEKVLCGLGRRLRSTGRLDAEGVQLAFENLPRFVAIASGMGVQSLHVVATSAVRDAEDGADFVARVRADTGLSIQVLSGDDEARLSAMGVLSGAPWADGVVGDLGGGSLELVRLRDGEPAAMVTLPLGPLRLNEWAASGSEIGALIKSELGGVPWLREAAGADLYVVGGSWRALARIHMAQRRRRLRILDGYTVAPASFGDFLKLIARQSDEGLLKQGSFNARRLDAIRPAARVMRQLVKTLKPNRLVFSARGLREGVLFDALPPLVRAEDPLIASARALSAQFSRFAQLGESLAVWTDPLFPGGDAERGRLRRAASLLSDMGWIEHPDYRAENSFDQALTLPVMGFEHPGRAFVAHALFARYGGGLDDDKKAIAFEAGLSEEDLSAARALGQALRLGYTMSAGRVDILSASRLSLADGEVCLDLPDIGRRYIGDRLRRRLVALASTLEAKALIRIDGEPLD